MPLKWTPELSVGDVEIDNQHKELIGRVNIFLTGLTRYRGREEIKKLFPFLEGYMIAHFAAEEKHLQAIPPDDEARKYRQLLESEHAAFIRDFLAFRDELEEKGPSPQLISEFQQWIGNWLANHFQKVDRGLIRFIRKAGAANNP